MAISPKDVEALSRLARIQLTDEELACFAGQMEEILSHVEKLKAAKTDGVPPTSHVLPLSNVFREDTLQPSLPVDQALANAPGIDPTCRPETLRLTEVVALQAALAVRS